MPDLPDQQVCSVECALVWGPGANLRRRKDNLRTTKQKLDSLQIIFNKWVRLRDSHLPCVSCGRWHKGQWHAGHFKPVGGQVGTHLRFNPDNCHRQCSVCNNHHSGRLGPYREELLRRIGPEKLAYLEGPHAPKSWSDEEIQDLRVKYTQKIKDIQAYFPDNDEF